MDRASAEQGVGPKVERSKIAQFFREVTAQNEEAEATQQPTHVDAPSLQTATAVAGSSTVSEVTSGTETNQGDGESPDGQGVESDDGNDDSVDLAGWQNKVAEKARRKLRHSLRVRVAHVCQVSVLVATFRKP